MKKLFVQLVLALMTFSIFAQAPQKMSYQAVIRNSTGQLVANHAVGMKISILQGSASGTAVYVETQTATTNANGLVTIEIGGGTVVTGTFAEIDWSNGTYFIKTETDPTGGTSYTITGTSQLLSVPYALHAKSAETAADAVKITGDQSIAGVKTFTGTINANNNIIINVASPLTATDAANKAYVDALSDKVLQLQTEIGAKDVDGNIYKAVKIGSQVWMAENLKTTKYKDGTDIPSSYSASVGQDTPFYWWFDNNEATYKNTYGALYNWYTVNTGILCPNGWHVPTNAEWTILSDYLGGTSKAGGKLKEKGTVHWTSPNTDATNESGFTALPGGYRYWIDHNFHNIGEYGNWWSSTQDNADTAWYRKMDYNNSSVAVVRENKHDGFSVRCISDYVINYKVHYIGERYGGGIVFWVHDNGQHGLITIRSDENQPPWVSQMEKWDNAAKVCDDYSVTVDGITYDDWYLPSSEELELLCSVKSSLDCIFMDYYWSSSLGNESGWAIFIYFKECWIYKQDINHENPVIAIRAF